MTSETAIAKVKKWISWILPGASFTGASIYTIEHSEFVSKLAIWGTMLLAALWLVIWGAFKVLRIRPDRNSTIVSPGMRFHLFILGAIGALWLPFLIQPAKAEKVEIVLDVSQRMGVEFDPPGTTKLDAARAGVLDVLDSLKEKNIKVALRLIDSTSSGQCVTEPDTSLVVDFTRDFNKIRKVLNSLKPRSSDKAPVVNAIDFSINHYLNNKLFDQKFYLYSFIGGDDTCGKNLRAYFSLPMVVDNAVNTQLFLIVLQDTDEEKTLKDLPHANLAYARSAIQVQQIVQTYNRLIVPPTPIPLLLPLLIRPTNEVPSETSTATDQVPITDTFEPAEPSETIEKASPTDKISVPITKTPIPTRSATPQPSPTRILTQTSNPTPIPPPPPTAIPIYVPTNVPTDIPTAIPTDTPQPTSTFGVFTWTVLTSQPEVFSTNCFLLNSARVYAQFSQSQAGISATLVSGGHTGQGLRLDFNDAFYDSGDYAGWEIWLGANDFSGIDLSSYNSLVFYIKGRDGGEKPNVYLMMPTTNDYERFWKDIELVTPVTTSWKKIIIPLSDFTLGQKEHQHVDLNNIQRIQILFEWYDQPTSGRVFIDDLCVQ